MKEEINRLFKERFGTQPLIVRSPGRINLIGEHTDYNEGFVLPAAIDKAIYVGIGKRDDGKIVLYSRHYNEEEQTSLDPLSRSGKRWANYILGVVDQLQKRKYNVGGFSMVIDGDVPLGSGLSSSAAVECSTIFALNELYSLGIAPIEMVKMAQLAEHTFIGVKCGIMDQFASMLGKKDHVIKLDCRSLEAEYIPLDLEGYKIVLFNTNVKHSLASSEYNTRRAQCEQGVSMVKLHEPQVKSMRDVDLKMLIKYVLPKDPLVFKRCKFILDENKRLLDCCDDLKRGDINALGKKMFQSHLGLSKEYEVSCRELDFLVEEVIKIEMVAGARMMGGGFGGCTINLIRENAIENVVESLSGIYKQNFGLTMTYYIVATDKGSEIISATGYNGSAVLENVQAVRLGK